MSRLPIGDGARLREIMEKAGGHKYTRRWRGPDGQWQYEYPDKGQQPRKKKLNVHEQRWESAKSLGEIAEQAGDAEAFENVLKVMIRAKDVPKEHSANFKTMLRALRSDPEGVPAMWDRYKKFGIREFENHLETWTGRSIPQKPAEAEGEYIGDPVPSWVQPGAKFKVKRKGYIPTSTRTPGSKEYSATGGEIGVIRVAQGKDWWSYHVEFPRGRHTNLDARVLNSSVQLKKSLSKAGSGGWQPIPGGKKGGRRRRKGKGWEYDYGYQTPKGPGIEERLKAHKQKKIDAARARSKQEAAKRLQQTLDSMKAKGPGRTSHRSLNFSEYEHRVARMPTETIRGAIKDILNTLPGADALDREQGTDNGGYYRDQASVLRQELERREKTPRREIQSELWRVNDELEAVKWRVEAGQKQLSVGPVDRSQLRVDQVRLSQLQKQKAVLEDRLATKKRKMRSEDLEDHASLQADLAEARRNVAARKEKPGAWQQRKPKVTARDIDPDYQDFGTKKSQYSVPIRRFVVPKAGSPLQKAGGWGPIPGGKKGGQRRWTGKGYAYRYPDGKGGWKSSPSKSKPKSKQLGLDFEAAEKKAEDTREKTQAGTLSEIIRVAGAALKIGDLLRPFGDNSFRILNIERKGAKLKLTTLHVQEAEEVVLEVKPTDQVWAQVASAEPAPTYPEDKPPENTPRAEAKKERKKELRETEYLNDRVSRVEQRGKDVGGSARHRAMEWKTVSEALTSEHAEKMFTRDFLTRQEPIDFIGRVQNDENFGTASLAQLFLYFCQNKIPTKPLKKPDLREWYIRGKGRPRSNLVYSGYMAMTTRGREWREMSADDKKKLEGEYVKQLREQYYTAFTKIREVLNKHSTNPDPSPMNLWRDVSRDLRMQRMDATGMFERAVLERVHKAINGRGKTAPIRAANEVAKRVMQEHPDDLESQKKQLREVMLKILEGSSVPAAFGEKGKGKKRFDVAQFYNTNKMQRKGPPSRYKGVTQGLDLLDKESGRSSFEMRHIQWGKTVTDYEREHHLKSLVDSFDDLAWATGLPPEIMSYNGKLAVAVGARGQGGALAHYENGEKIINLTRNKGAGALAHEWGHFFDYQVGAAEDRAGHTNTDGEALSEREEWRSATQQNHYEGAPMTQAVMSLKSSDGWVAFSKRLPQVIKDHPGIGEKQAEYWQSSKEMFARCFERHVQIKLEKAGRENTYLSGVASRGGLWPTDEEVEAMAPHFDKIFERFKDSGLLEKMMRWADEDRLQKSRYTVPARRFTVGAG